MKTVSAKVPNDIKKRIREYREENDISQSEAVRRLLLSGLQDDLEGSTIDQRLGAIESSLQSLEERINNDN